MCLHLSEKSCARGDRRGCSSGHVDAAGDAKGGAHPGSLQADAADRNCGDSGHRTGCGQVPFTARTSNPEREAGRICAKRGGKTMNDTELNELLNSWKTPPVPCESTC